MVMADGLKKKASRIFGHQNAIQSVREIIEGCGDLGIAYLTLYVFSKENWGRPAEEIRGIMELLVDTINKEYVNLVKNKVKLIAVGDLQNLPKPAQKALKKVSDASKNNKKLTLILAINYSGRWEIVEAAKKIAQDTSSGLLKPTDINEAIFKNYLPTKNIPDPGLLIRTSGEMRISNFLLWQIAYTELFITKVLWPEFTRKDLYKAILAYQQRNRRFGKAD